MSDNVETTTPAAVKELLVYDSEERCPYIEGNTARMPLRWPTEKLNRVQTDALFEAGDRRSGPYVYHTKCPACEACEPIRLEVADFALGRTQKRVLKRGDRLLKIKIGEPTCDSRRIELYNRHKQQRGLDQRGVKIDESDYQAFLVETCCETIEISYWLDDVLVAIAISDRGETSLNAVYCYYDVDHANLSLGTYSVLKQIELCQQWGLRYLYLGLYIAESPPMKYKGNYLPHERLISGTWQRFEKPTR